MTPQQIDLVQTSFAQVRATPDAVAALFYHSGSEGSLGGDVRDRDQRHEARRGSSSKRGIKDLNARLQEQLEIFLRSCPLLRVS